MKISHLSLLACLFISSGALALSTDTEQPVYIDSDSQQLDLKSNQVTFVGNVTLKQGSINIHADKLIVTRNPQDGQIETIQGFGNLATFSQLTDEGKTLYGEAKKLNYQMAADQLTMTDKAMLSQDDSVIHSTKIRYKISAQKLIADGNSNERVSTVLQPQATNKE
ncbi:lipopolysaccharide transport periplasmic protein LptA [Vibrio spartinae]|uniref:Lipopolysaccharide export system protein LptA n=1 Tax=Vibrio spartinae TaxID=1918945 RepID=A0A1N6M224_9VIBR|nr:lipopolysaccharide transport periplasmic protein LptA [Vibrio spartinae]QMV13208.1 Lipopolysaccharide export system protein LptA precursor [Vibrio spartinae]SIO93494.1 Lipopolysaccharide export system protein LptA precursor [Vibrio spartinae]